MNNQLDREARRAAELQAVIAVAIARGWLEGFMAGANKFTVRIRGEHVLIGRGPGLEPRTERKMSPRRALDWMVSPTDLPFTKRATCPNECTLTESDGRRRYKTGETALESGAQVQIEEVDRITGLLREAADLLDPPADDSTVEVRILARVDVIGGEVCVAAAAYPNATDDDLFERVGLDAEDNWTDHPRFTWIRARVPKPVIDEVEGTVES